jgi:glycosyltransferase involved in cell wall biosynthesis
MKQRQERPRALLAQRANVERYPPVLHQLRVLSEFCDCTVLDDLGMDEDKPLHSSDVVKRERIRSTRLIQSLGTLGKLRNVLSFSAEFDRLLRCGPNISIAYDPYAAAELLWRRESSLKRVVHLHELLDVNAGGRADRLSVRYIRNHLCEADLVIVPDAHRARLTQSFAKLSKRPTVVMNCPALLLELPSSRLLPSLRERGFETSRIVHYQGSVGAEHGLELIIDSMQYWPSDSVFVIVGGGKKEYVTALRARAASIGMGDRLVLLGLVPYSDVFSFAVGASVGLTLLDCSIKNWRFSAGASNKRFEYVALGIPQITNAGPGMHDVFGEEQLAIIVDDLTPQSLGCRIASVLGNPEFRAATSYRARSAHIRKYNYESQFAPVAERLRSWLYEPA